MMADEAVVAQVSDGAVLTRTATETLADATEVDNGRLKRAASYTDNVRC